MKKKNTVGKVLIVILVLTVVLWPYIWQLISLQKGTMQEVVFSRMAPLQLDSISLTDYDSEGNDRDLDAEEMEHLYAYLQQVRIRTEFPQKSASYGGSREVYLAFRSGKGVPGNDTAIMITYVDDETVSIRVGNGKRIAYQTDNLDWADIFAGSTQ